MSKSGNKTLYVLLLTKKIIVLTLGSHFPFFKKTFIRQNVTAYKSPENTKSKYIIENARIFYYFIWQNQVFCFQTFVNLFDVINSHSSQIFLWSIYSTLTNKFQFQKFENNIFLPEKNLKRINFYGIKAA